MNDVSGKPHLSQIESTSDFFTTEINHPTAGSYYLYAEKADELIFTDNETNAARFDLSTNGNPHVKDAFHRYLINGNKDAVNPAREGTKVAALFSDDTDPGMSCTIRLRLAGANHEKPFAEFDSTFTQRIAEADKFYDAIHKPNLGADEKRVQWQALAGMLWTKQFFYYNIKQWLQGDSGLPPVPEPRRQGRNSEWEHLNNFDINFTNCC